jgi:RNA polymerase sigma factor (sigma-70 family)
MSAPSNVLEEEFLVKLKAGDDSAWTYLWDKEAWRLLVHARKYAQSYGLSKEDAQEACMDAFISLIKALKTSSVDELSDKRKGKTLELYFRKWLLKATINKLIDKSSIKEERNEEQLSSSSDEIESEDFIIELATPSIDLTENRVSLAIALKDAFAKLPPNERKILQLYLEGYTTREIAEHLGVSLNLIRVRLYRAKAQLKRELSSAQGE